MKTLQAAQAVVVVVVVPYVSLAEVALAASSSRANHRRNKTLASQLRDSRVKTSASECRRKRNYEHPERVQQYSHQIIRVHVLNRLPPNRFLLEAYAFAASGNASPKTTTRKMSHMTTLHPWPPLLEALASLAVRTRMSMWGKPGKPLPVTSELCLPGCLPVLASASECAWGQLGRQPMDRMRRVHHPCRPTTKKIVITIALRLCASQPSFDGKMDT